MKKFEPTLSLFGPAPGAVENLQLVTIYTDGACTVNPGGAGGWACILISGRTEKEFSGHIPKHPTVTSNRAEMQAVIEGLSRLKRRCRVTLYSDSQICVWAINGRKNGKFRALDKCKNPDLVAKIRELIVTHEVTAEWVKGHAGNRYNERCDYLAETAARNPP